jgi:uncharacterized membrane protein
MKTMMKKDYLAGLVVMTPVISLLAFVTYKFALEIWCIAYGLIY